MKKNRSSSARPTPKSSATPSAPDTESSAPFADLMLHPEKIDAVLKDGPAQIPAPNAAASNAGAKTKNSPVRQPGTPKPEPVQKETFFHLQRHAKSVRLAGDFTNWDQAPIEMYSKGDDKWAAIVSLEPGEHAYRFIVDGEWCTDPNCMHRVTNPFGTENSVIEVR